MTPGRGKSLLPVIAAARLIAAGVVDRVCWIVPRDSLRLQAEEAFADPAWRAALGHAVSVRAAENAPDPCRGLGATSPPTRAWPPRPTCTSPSSAATATCWSSTKCTTSPPRPGSTPWPRGRRGRLVARHPAAAGDGAVRLLLCGTLERADGRAILWLPYRRGESARTREVDLEAPGFAVVGYSRAQALAEKAVLPVRFGALDGEAEWLDEERRQVGPQRLSGAPEAARAAALHGAAHRLRRRTCCAGPSTPPGNSGPPGATPGASRPETPPGASASCWWWRRTRRTPAATSRGSAAGCRAAQGG